MHGLALQRNNNSSITITKGSAIDTNGNVTSIAEDFTISLAGIRTPSSSDFRWVMVTLATTTQSPNGYIRLSVGGVNSNTKPTNTAQNLLLGYFMYRNSGAVSTDTAGRAPTGITSYVSSQAKKEIKAKLAAMYPVGAIFVSANSISPATFLEGTWHTIDEGTFLGQQGRRYPSLNGVYSDGLPNITGSFWAFDTNQLSGAFHRPSHRHNGNRYEHGANYNWGKVEMDAHRSSSIYGSANHVQPKTLAVNIWRRTA